MRWDHTDGTGATDVRDAFEQHCSRGAMTQVGRIVREHPLLLRADDEVTTVGRHAHLARCHHGAGAREGHIQGGYVIEPGHQVLREAVRQVLHNDNAGGQVGRKTR